MKKKLLALGLTLCMALSMTSAVFAAETTPPVATEATTEASETSVARNIDYYTYPNQILDGYKTVRVMDLCQVFRHIFLRIYMFFQASLEQLI